MLIRHAEKPVSGINGINIFGSSDKESLIPQGWQRAGALCSLFAPSSGPIRQGLVTPQLIFASAAKPSGSKSLRPEETVVPLTALLNGITDQASFFSAHPPKPEKVPLNLSYTKGDGKELVHEVLASPGDILIAWQHEELIPILTKFAHHGPVNNPDVIPSEWPGERFDMVFVLTGNHEEGYVFTQVPQLLLPGDSAQPFP